MARTKRQIRIEILNTLDNHCSGCKQKKEYANRPGKVSVEQLCLAECPVAERLHRLGNRLGDDEKDTRRNWTKEETFYLMKHVPVLGFKKVAERLDRPEEKVKIKYDYEKTKKKTPHVAV